MATIFARYALFTVFIVSGLGKLRARREETLLTFLGISKPLQTYLVTAVSVSEFAVATGLIFPRTSQQAGRLAFALISIFSTVAAAAFVNGFRGDCGCFGKSLEHRSGVVLACRNSFLLLLTLKVVRNKQSWVPTGSA